MLNVSTHTVKQWRHHGLLRAHRYNDRDQWLYEPPGDQPPVKQQGRKFTKRLPSPVLVTQRPDEVQYETLPLVWGFRTLVRRCSMPLRSR